MSSLPPSWETFVSTVCNASIATMKYFEVTSAIMTEAALRKSLAKHSTNEAYVVQGSADRPNNRGRNSSRPPTNQLRRSKSQNNRTCIYCKKPWHIKTDYHTLKARNEMAQRADNKGGRQEEVNYVGTSPEVLTGDHNILSIENPAELEVLLTTIIPNIRVLLDIINDQPQGKRWWVGNNVFRKEWSRLIGFG